MLRVVLVQPPDTGAVRTLHPHLGEGTEGIGFKPPLGILSMAATLTDRSIHRVSVIDALAERLSLDDLVERVARAGPDVVGVSAWTDFWYPAYGLGQRIKARLPDAHLVVGGPHVGVFPQETLDAPFVDSIVAGDGEVPLLILCNMLSHGIRDNRFPGLHLKEFGVKSGGDAISVDPDPGALPFPDRTLLSAGLYGSVLARGEGGFATMITSRGCPHRCTFCRLRTQPLAQRSAESVVAEFQALRDSGVREIEIYDDTFTWSSRRFRNICESLIAEEIGRDLRWSVRDRVDSTAPGKFELMHRAGCWRVHFGIESGVQRVVDKMSKHITLEQARQAVYKAKEAGMTVVTHFMFGNEDETIKDMEETVTFALSLDSDYAEFSVTVPYPGTELYDNALASGAVSTDHWREFARRPVPAYLPKILETHASLADVRDIQKKAIRSFYFRPSYLVRRVARLGSAGEFTRQARLGLRLLGGFFG